MSIRTLFVSVFAAGLLAVGFLSLAPVAKAVPLGQSFQNTDQSVRSDVIDIADRGRAGPSGVRIIPPIVPYIAYDFPYYFNRGFYPTHIKPGYLYNNYHVVERVDPYADEVRYAREDKERCAEKYRSFEWDTGEYTTYSGKKKLCPFLR